MNTCEFCRTGFTPFYKRPEQRYCSTKCRSAAARVRYGWVTAEIALNNLSNTGSKIACVWCNKRFTQRGGMHNGDKRQVCYSTTCDSKYRTAKKFGLSVIAYKKMVDDCNGLCSICHNPSPDGRDLAVDHNHKTGAVRGLLCLNCNTKLGWLETNRMDIEAYLSRDEGAV